MSIDAPPQIFKDFLAEQGIELCQIISGEGMSIGHRISEQLVLDSLHIMLMPEKYPLVVTSNTGMHRTGTIIGCLRRLENWSLSNIFEEFRRFTGLKASNIHEQFVELFDTDLVQIPPNVHDLPFVISINPKHQIAENDDTPIKLSKKNRI